MDGITEVVLAVGSNQKLRYLLEGSTLVIWVGEMIKHAPADADEGHVTGEGDAFSITIRDDNPKIFMPRTPDQLQ